MTFEEIKWGEVRSDYQEFTLKGVPFRLATANHNAQSTTEEYIVLLKNQNLLRSEIRMLDYATPKNIVELGIYEGGSAVFWHLLYGAKYIGFDILKAPNAIHNWVRRLGIDSQVKLHYEVSQDDQKAINGAIDDLFGNEPIDVVIDDASHQYALSRRTFEILYPLLRSGGIYCLEDWSWAHADSAPWQEKKMWGDAPALSNLLFEITMLLGTKSDWFSQLVTHRQAAYVFSTGKAPKAGFTFDNSILKQGRRFSPI
jgi:cephalosporin hydroxylase